jgi:hypothetical protein
VAKNRTLRAVKSADGSNLVAGFVRLAHVAKKTYRLQFGEADERQRKQMP